jgi:hypothetical protein
MRMSGSRLAPIVAGAAGLLWFWTELAPIQAGFEDMDSPAVGLKFIAAHPGSWTQAGLVLAIAAIALVATVIGMRDRFEVGAPGAPGESGESGAPERGVAVRTVSVIGLFAALFLLGHAATRLAAGPLTYVQGLDQAWGEAAYLVAQFVGVQLFGVAGAALLSIWIAGAAWLGARRGVLPQGLAVLAAVPSLRLLALPGLALLPWFLLVLAIPSAFVWLILLGAWPAGLALGRTPAPEVVTV